MAPATRLQMVSSHFSTSPSSSSAPPPAFSSAEVRLLACAGSLRPHYSPSAAPLQATVKFEATHSLRTITLNRPKAFNALSAEMVQLIQPQLEVSATTASTTALARKGR